MDFLQQLDFFIKENTLFQKEDKILLAVSGGIDSVVLAHALHLLGYKFNIAHCNFQLRGEESNADEAFARQLSHNLDVTFFCETFDTKKLANSEGISIQMAARQLRYNWFEDLRKTHHFKYIVTAHHQNDSLETILLNLVRGTGIAGLHGIKPRNGYLVRPLLFTTRTHIEAFASKRDLTWREDSSNSSLKYARNHIRHQVVPLLKQLNPSLEHTIAHSVKRIALAESFIAHALDLKKADCVKTENGTVKINIKQIQNEPNALFVLSSFLHEFGFELDTSQQILDSANKIPGKTFKSNEYLLIKDRGYWIISRHSENQFHKITLMADAKEAFLDDGRKISIELITGGLEIIDSLKRNDVCFFDYDQLPFPLTIRPWEFGDYLLPFGMNGKKKISDILIDKKINILEKEKTLVLATESEILAIVGIRSSRLYSVSPSTKRIWILRLEEHYSE